MSEVIDWIKVVIAYICTFGAIIVPVPALWCLVIHYHGTDYFFIAALAALVLSAPVFWFGAYLSFRLGKWFLENWAGKYVKDT